MTEELYKKHRPKTLSDLVGNLSVRTQLSKMMQQQKIPHFILFTGPSGCGKTTLARILANELDCNNSDFREVNAANDRGVDTVRDIQGTMHSKPMWGQTRVWIVDEAHQITTTAQNAWLKMLEDTPAHVYFFFATTDPKKLLPTVRTRATLVNVDPLTEADMLTLLKRVCRAERVKIRPSIAQEIIKCSEGSARQALVFLNSVMYVKDPKRQLKLIHEPEDEEEAVAIARLLFGWGKIGPWANVAKLLRDYKGDPEQARRCILGYGQSILLSGKNAAQVHEIMSEFEEPYYNIGKPGLVMSCYRAWDLRK